MAIPGLDVYEIDPERIVVNSDGTAAKRATVQPLGAQGPQVNRNTFAGPPRPPAQPATPGAPGPGPLRAVIQEGGARARAGLPGLTGPQTPMSGMSRAVGRAGGVGTAAFGLVDAAQNGVNPNNALDVASGAMMASGTPVGIATGGALALGNTAGRVINGLLPDSVKDTIGGTINAGLRMFGGGVNDDALVQLNNSMPNGSYTSARPVPSIGTAPVVPARANPNFSNEARATTMAAPAAGGIRRRGNLFTDGSTRQPGELTGVNGPTDYERKLAADWEARQAAEAAQQGGATMIADSRQSPRAVLERETDMASFLAGSSLSRNAREGTARLKAASNALDSLDKRDALATAERNASTAAGSARYAADAGIKEAGLRAQGATQAAAQRFMLEQMVAERDRGLVRSAFKTGDPAGTLARSGRLDLSKDAQGYTQGVQGQTSAADAESRKKAADSVDLFKGEFTTMDKDGKPVFDEVGARQAADTLNRLAPNFASLPPDQQKKMQLQASLVTRLQRKVAGGDYTGRTSTSAARASEVMPDIRGGSLARYGTLRGAVTPGISGGEYGLTLPDGKEINVGDLTQQERELLQDYVRNGPR
jgi:hypothetical protein